jgi:hypothetical protein
MGDVSLHKSNKIVILSEAAPRTDFDTHKRAAVDGDGG